MHFTCFSCLLCFSMCLVFLFSSVEAVSRLVNNTICTVQHTPANTCALCTTILVQIYIFLFFFHSHIFCFCFTCSLRTLLCLPANLLLSPESEHMKQLGSIDIQKQSYQSCSFSFPSLLYNLSASQQQRRQWWRRRLIN